MSLSYLRQMRERRGNKTTPSDNNENTIISHNVMNKEKHSIHEKIKNRNSWLLVFAGGMFTLLIFAVVFYRFIINNESANIDTATILTTLLAFFSIYLSATFYFKATEQSNQFYDRSFSHTRDIAKTLSAMEGRFGEGLKNIEQYSNRLNDRFDNLPFINNSLQENVIHETQKNIHEILKAMEGGSISKDEMKKYEEKFFHIENENKELKKALNKNKQDYSIRDKIAFFFNNINRNYGLAYLLNLSTKDLANVIKNEALGYGHYDNKFLDELINQGIFDNELNLTAEGIVEFKEYLKKINK